jgi:putative SOS response-associated peptidase YedK
MAFYEWMKLDGERIPYRIAMADGGPMAFAGLWDSNRALAIESFTIVTTAANYSVRALHDRMPVILRPADFARWLDPAAPAADLLTPAPDDAPRLFRVSPKMNPTKTDEPSCIKPLTT